MGLNLIRCSATCAGVPLAEAVDAAQRESLRLARYQIRGGATVAQTEEAAAGQLAGMLGVIASRLTVEIRIDLPQEVDSAAS